MMNLDEFNNHFDQITFSLSREDILEFDKTDNGAINNVISGINKHCFGVHFIDDEIGLAAKMFYITNEPSLKGDIICLELDDPYYFELLVQFCNLLAEDYGVDVINAFNILQTELRTFLEKSGFFTISTLELKQFEGKDGTVFGSSPRGYKVVKIIDRISFYRKYFNGNYQLEVIPGNDYVYLMVNDATALIKIGTSKKPFYREKTLHSQEPTVHLIALWCCDKSKEKALHNLFSSKRVRGEWFRLTLTDLKEIEQFMASESQLD